MPPVIVTAPGLGSASCAAAGEADATRPARTQTAPKNRTEPIDRIIPDLRRNPSWGEAAARTGRRHSRATKCLCIRASRREFALRRHHGPWRFQGHRAAGVQVRLFAVRVDVEPFGLLR